MSSMQIKSFEITAMECKRFTRSGEKIPNIKIESNSSITQIKKMEGDQANIDFRFTANYASLGYIHIEGQMLVHGDVDPLINEWKSTGSMPADDANLIHNTIVSNCIPTSVLIAKEIKLPAPIPLPRINVQKKSEAKHFEGVEVA